MNLKETLKEKINAQNSLLNTAVKAGRAMSEDEQTQFDAFEVEIKNIEKTIEASDKIAKREVEEKKVVNEVIHASARNAEKDLKLFKNFGEQLIAIKKVATDGVVDERLQMLNKQNQYKNAILGGNETIDSEGGFAVQEDFAGFMMNSAATAGNILPLVDRYEVSNSSNSVEWTDIDESSVATTVFGGVQVYWSGEAIGASATIPKLREVEVKLLKLLGFAYSTYELENDTNFISTLYTKAFTTAIQRELESSIIAGTGVGKPLGFTKSNSLVSVAKESGQAANTVVWENIVKMYNRQLDKSKAVWIVHPDVHEQLDFLAFPVGVGGVPVYLPASAVGTLDTLKGRPVIDSDHCSTLGTVGDINFADLSQYFLATKGGLMADSSMHVQFLTAQNCYRFIFRANGLPKKNTALTIKNSSNTRSSFVSLATRA